ncbi:hypothetical protein SAMN05428997_11383 [Bosea sp. CRIB-10]|jgi:hypothetical protein|uniref:hypothetical protein n=1 Tax=Bosea sp. CRIB-10 TaxID=378404 RepID=UPI0008EC529D|nr:hypothetical protein [Bosea sp. CRIB-10]SFC89692.1 hypothetical protein SAMN05428997_11383 [Bosea sp. CRIB-10]
MSRQSVTMRELQKMSAGAIQALPHPVPIKSGSATVGLLVPVKRPDTARISAALKRADAYHATLSPETKLRLERFLGERDD